MMKARHDSILAVRLAIPWWVSFTAAATAYIFCSFLAPSLMSGNPALSRLGDWLIEAAPFLTIMFAAIGAFAFFRELDLRRLRQTQGDLDAIRGMDWQNFELLVAEGFRRLGYTVDNQGWYFPNSRVHITLQKGGERTLVDCRDWQAAQVGLPPVRELYKTLNSEHADGALLVTSGSFTLDAEAFARDKPIGLIDGPALLELVATVKRDAAVDASNADAPCCPVCERPMKRKKASGTSTIGHVYWGCSAYPRCLGTRPVQLADLRSSPLPH